MSQNCNIRWISRGNHPHRRQLSSKKMCPRVIWGRGVRLSTQSLIFNQKLLLGRKTELGKSFGLDRLGIQIPLRDKQKNIWSKIHFSKGHKTQRGLARLTLQCMWSKHRAVDNWHLITDQCGLIWETVTEYCDFEKHLRNILYKIWPSKHLKGRSGPRDPVLELPK